MDGTGEMGPVILLLLGCQGPDERGPCTPVEGGISAVVATTDYDVGALAVVGDDGGVRDTLHLLGGDPHLRWAGNEIAVLERGGADRIALYDPSRLGCPPRLEVPLPQGGNPHDVVVEEDVLWVALYDHPELLGYAPETGDPQSVRSLSEFADPDGLPEATQLWQTESGLSVVIDRFERPAWDTSEGALVSEEGQITELGPSPDLISSESGVLLRTGLYGVLDGGIGPLGGEPVVREEEIGRDLDHVAVLGAHAVFSGVTPGSEGTYEIFCWDLPDGEIAELGLDTPSFVSEITAVGDEVWVSLRKNYATSRDGVVGIIRVDPVSCTVVGTPLAFSLDPYSILPL